jgi:hypothetical protein
MVVGPLLEGIIIETNRIFQIEQMILMVNKVHKTLLITLVFYFKLMILKEPKRLDNLKQIEP